MLMHYSATGQEGNQERKNRKKIDCSEGEHDPVFPLLAACKQNLNFQDQSTLQCSFLRSNEGYFLDV